MLQGDLIGKEWMRVQRRLRPQRKSYRKGRTGGCERFHWWKGLRLGPLLDVRFREEEELVNVTKSCGFLGKCCCLHHRKGWEKLM